MKSRRGITLIEVIVALVILGTASYVANSFLVSQRKSLASLDKRETLQSVIIDTITEIDSKTLEDLPLAGSCWIRNYSLTGHFLDSQNGSEASGNCTVSDVAKGKIKVVVVASSSVSIATSAVFEPADFLKLPKYVDSVRQIETKGAVFHPNDKDPIELALTSYKRAY